MAGLEILSALHTEEELLFTGEMTKLFLEMFFKSLTKFKDDVVDIF